MSTNTEDESFHPLGEEWESQLGEMLDDTEYDTELGLAMAEDAQRLVAGEMTEAAFHEKYHEDVLAEFGEDQRPTEEAYEELRAKREGLLGALSSFDGDGEEGRREVLKKMGVGGAALGVGALASSEGGDPGQPAVASAHGAEDDEDEGTQWGMTIDLEVCDGCLTCVTACQSENNLDQGVNWMYVLAYEDSTTTAPTPEQFEEGEVGQTDFPWLVRPCQHCTDAPCEKVCPTTARHTRSQDGIVLTDYDVCIGCRYCQVACPYGVNYFQWEEPSVSQAEIAEEKGGVDVGEAGDHIHDERGRRVDSRAPRGVMSKCTFCPTRQDGFGGEEMVGTTACMEACPPGAIQFGDVNDEASDARIYGDNPSMGRALEEEIQDAPEPETVAEELSGESDMDVEGAAAVEDLDTDTIEIAAAISILTEELEVDRETDRPRAIGPLVAKAEGLADALAEAGLGLDDEAVRSELRLGEGTEEDATELLRAHKGGPESSFELMGDIGTNPNVTYVGNEPGPDAEQTEGWISYEDVGLTDSRQDVVGERTVDGGMSP